MRSVERWIRLLFVGLVRDRALARGDECLGRKRDFDMNGRAKRALCSVRIESYPSVAFRMRTNVQLYRRIPHLAPVFPVRFGGHASRHAVAPVREWARSMWGHEFYMARWVNGRAERPVFLCRGRSMYSALEVPATFGVLPWGRYARDQVRFRLRCIERAPMSAGW